MTRNRTNSRAGKNPSENGENTAGFPERESLVDALDHECPEDERCPECGSMPADMIGDMVLYGTTAREYTTIMAALKADKRRRDDAQLTEVHGDPLLRKDAA